MSSNKLIKLTYFDFEGFAEPVRLALLLSGTPFEDNRVSFSDWLVMKPTTPGGHLPIMTIGDDPTIKRQSSAMLRWVCMTKSSTLYPKDKVYEIEEALGDLEDLGSAFHPAQVMGMCPFAFGYPVGFEKTEEGKRIMESMRVDFITNKLPIYMKRLTDKMSKHNCPFFIDGSEPTIVDCMAIPMLRNFTRGYLDYVDPKCLDAYPTIVSYIKTFCALEQIQGRYKDGIY
jgi:prostaglandin-H2 D-isomerase / glutathione transferase